MRRDDVARFLISVRKEMTARDVVDELAQCGVSNTVMSFIGAWAGLLGQNRRSRQRVTQRQLFLYGFLSSLQAATLTLQVCCG